MALPELLERIERDAALRISQELETARARAAEILAAAEASAQRTRGDALVVAEQRLRAAMAQRLAAARRQVRREQLLAREQLLERVFAAARRNFATAAESARFKQHMVALLATARSYLPPDSATEPVPVANGYQLTAPDGALSIDITLDSELARYEARLRMLVCSRIEADHAQDAVVDA